ncbi:lysozyme inhibitor LprI family protein [Paraburkholderia sp. SOS3]|uniref:lysozyme inhibitor LprI family protein n=1 Tax=Paraburkholderia sp. SOS3 TaxID=1926494 RepID=UPI00094761C2|nr:lysozyme inhibitor LprI family protein [Paraburkholderia sp. SOS3]APR38896.1 hypothetical protein BTO02_26270 [Paraburkholderia sp. SOS3]
MKRLAFFLIGLVCTSLHAAATDPVDEIANRSGLPASEVSALIANCDASQTSMNFCAWRDQLVAEQNLHLVMADREAQSPTCKARLEKQISRWITQRDRACRSEAQQAWGTGSMRQAAQATCAAKQTETLIGKVKAFGCR